VRIIAAALLLTLLAPAAAHAVQPDEVMADAAQEARARALSRELRCMVCQNQSIDDSDAPLARDLRLLVRERIAAGATDQQVMDFLVARYGEFVLLKPSASGHNLLLWALPPLVLVGGGIALWVHHRRRRTGASSGADAVEHLTADEEARLARLTGGDNVAPPV